MRLKNRKNMERLIIWADRNYPKDWAIEILNRCCDDAFPPYEFWASMHHPNTQKMEFMVARSIAKWIEQQHEYTQDFVLDLLNLIPFDMPMTTASLSIWALMLPHAWLKRHAVDTGHKSNLWINALLHLRRAIHEDTWHAIRNYQAEFFIAEEAADE